MLKHKTITNKVFKLIDKLRFDEALSLVEVQRLYAKKDPFYYSIYAIIHLYMNKFHDAKLFINKALNFNPYYETALNAMAYIELSAGRVQEAIHLYIKILDINPRNKLVKRNLSRFKTNKKINSILSDLNPNSYLRERYLFNYQKVLIISLATASISLALIYYLYKTSKEPITNTQYAKERLRYQDLNYIPVEEENKLLKSLANDNLQNNMQTKLITLNKVLASNIDIAKKIKIEHNNRNIIYNYNNSKNYTPLSYPGKKDLFAKAYMYDSINVILSSKIKREGNIEYIIRTPDGDKIKLFDYDKKIPPKQNNKPIKILIRINASTKEKPFATVISVLY